MPLIRKSGSPVGPVSVLVASNRPMCRRVSKLSAMSSSSSIRIPNSSSKNTTNRTRPSESSCSGSSGLIIGGKEPRWLSRYSLSFGGISIMISVTPEQRIMEGHTPVAFRAHPFFILNCAFLNASPFARNCHFDGTLWRVFIAGISKMVLAFGYPARSNVSNTPFMPD
jgi:hypothetical protein